MNISASYPWFYQYLVQKYSIARIWNWPLGPGTKLLLLQMHYMALIENIQSKGKLGNQ